MKIQAGCLIAMFVVALLCFSTASALNNVTAFKTGPFNVIVDLGGPCDNVNIEPVSKLVNNLPPIYQEASDID